MIKVNEEYIKIEGEKPIIMAELASVIDCLINENDFTENEIDMIVSVGKMNDDELHKKNKEMLDKMLTMAFLGALFNGLKGEDDD